MPDNTGPAKSEQSVVRIRYRVREGACSFRNVEPIRFRNRALVRDWVMSSTICDPLVLSDRIEKAYVDNATYTGRTIEEVDHPLSEREA